MENPNGNLSRVCPACSKPIDPLRAGQVAVLDGAFVYYCDSACKRAHRPETAPSDLPTAAPPDVAPHRESRISLPPLAPAAVMEAAPSSVQVASSPNASRPDLGSAGGIRAATLVRGAMWGAVTLSILSVVLVAVRRTVGPPELTFLVLSALSATAWFALKPSNPTEGHRALPIAALLAMTIGCVGTSVRNGAAASGLVATAMSVLVLLGIDAAVRRAAGSIDAVRRGIREALDVPVRAVHGDSTVSVPSSQIRCGEVVLVRAGEVLGVDAVVVAGDAVVSPWFDAPVRQPKREGDVLVAGARVLEGELRLNVIRTGADRAWLALHDTASGRIDVAAPLSLFARRVLEPLALVVAVAFSVAFFVFTRRWAEAIVVGGSIAVALSARAAIGAVSMLYARAHLAALSHGVVYRDATTFERAAMIDQVVYCARGTLLLGEPEIISVEALSENSDDRVLGLAAAVGAVSRDPLILAVARAAGLRGSRVFGVRNVVESPGLGAVAVSADDEPVVVGSRALLLREKVSVAVVDARVAELEAQGRSVVLVALSGKLLGFVALQDGLRSGARASVQRLLGMRIEPVLLSTESRDTCEAIATALEIDHVRPEVLPGDRAAEVQALSDGGHAVGVIGQPASDDAPLAAAALAIAMTTRGSKQRAYGVELLVDDVLEASFALTIPRRARERAILALVAGTLPGVVATVGIGFGMAPLFVAPIAALVECSVLFLREREVLRA